MHCHKREHVPVKVRRGISAMPCAVCGVPYDVKADHVIPVSRGGGSHLSNLQPLCHSCNHIKHNRRSNDELRLIVLGRGVRHFMAAVYREDTRYENHYDRRSMAQWGAEQPDRVSHAFALWYAFLGAAA